MPNPLPQQTQPTLFYLHFKALLQLPYRLCNPPVATVGKVRSYSVTPIYNVQLEDVLNRKHLPPLGLKDFEEWLLFVEQCPENLYFILWLREYTHRYNHWAIKSKSKQKQPQPGYRVGWPAHNSPSLAMSYARAKKTFFTPNSSYELAIPSDILSPFHTSNLGSPHPDPAVFNEVANEVQFMLKDSLKRFVTSAYHNVGTRRAICGLIAGTVVALAGGIPPIAVNFVDGRSRWLRLLAIPGLWLGLTILITSLHGVCMMIYIFGDLRQLRKFELERPPISCPKPFSPDLLSQGAAQFPHQIPYPRSPPSITIAIPPRAAAKPHRHRRRRYSKPSLSSTLSSASTSTEDSLSTPGCRPASLSASSDDDDNDDGDPDDIYVSPPYQPDDGTAEYDLPTPADTPIQTPTSPTSAPVPPMPAQLACPSPPPSHTTATFIHPYTYNPCVPSDANIKDADACPARTADPEYAAVNSQPISPFDFDALPPVFRDDMPVPQQLHPPRVPEPVAKAELPPPPPPLSAPVITPFKTPFLYRLKTRSLVRDIEAYPFDSSTEKPASTPGGTSSFSVASQAEKGAAQRMGEKEAAPAAAAAFGLPCKSSSVAGRPNWRSRFRAVQRVPTFGPVTRVLSPVVSRAQWEIVVRSFVFAGIISWALILPLLAVPVRAR